MKTRAPLNRTLTLTETEAELYGSQLGCLSAPAEVDDIVNSILNQDLLSVLPLLPASFVDLLILDPPYNLTKTFNGTRFSGRSMDEYEEWMTSWFPQLLRTLTPTASVYICGDWRSSAAIHRIAEQYLTVRNRITWEREKGRGATANWKNCSEDIWFCTVSNTYTFNLDAVKLRRRVIAPYKTAEGAPRDWQHDDGGRFRLTHPSNIWTDITVPFWSMPENTEHPTQKPEKLLAKLILASSRPGDIVLDPFLGSGTSAVVAKKLGRKYVGIEIDQHYACLAEKRLVLAGTEPHIQGYENDVFHERNAQK